jgi:alpha-tubulin suppressor-like RCC1 family protein
MAWGANNVGQLGNGTTSTTANATPSQVLNVSGAIAAVAGEEHSLFLLNDATVKAVGENGAGQLGDTHTTDQSTPVSVTSLTDVTKIAAGADHSFALKSDGSAWGWGHGYQLGNGNDPNALSRVEITALSAVGVIAGNSHHSLGVTTNGTVFTWGSSNASGEQGDGTTVEHTTATAISGAGYDWNVATPVITPAGGSFNVNQSVAITSATSGATIHYTTNGNEPTTTDPTSVPVTVDHSLTLKARAWKSGLPTSGTASSNFILSPVQPTVSPTPGTTTNPANVPTVTFSTTTSGASIYYTTDGSTPTESSELYTKPFVVDHTTTFNIVAFKSGWAPSTTKTATYTMNFGTLAAPTFDPGTDSYTGSVSISMSSPQSGATIRYTTGNPNNSTPGTSSPIYTGPVPVTATTTVRAKVFHPDYAPAGSAETSRTYTMTAHTPTFSNAAGSYAPGSTVTITAGQATDTLRMTIDGTDPTTTSPTIATGTSIFLGNFTLKVKAWRSGAADSAVASAAYTLTSALGPGSAAAGGTHSLIATPDGRVIAWGKNLNGQLGNEGTTDKTTPTTLNTITGVTQVVGGQAHTLARTWDGQVFAWGNNGSGRLGDGSTTQRTKPTLITTLSNIVAVAAGDAHSLALTSDGHVYSWGLNSSGELGLGNTTSTSTPTLVPSLSDVIAIAAGSAHSLAVTSGGQLYAWGNDGSSRLGDGATANQSSPVLINLSNVVGAAAGAAHTIAMTSSGAVYSWGSGANGQLGRGNTNGATTPTLIPSLHVSAIAAGDNFSAAIRGDGVLVAWGLNSSGQIGDTFTTQRTSPVVVSGPSSVSSLSLGDAFSLGVTPTGNVWSWGADGSGQLGDGGTNTNRATPQAVISGANAIASWATAAPTVSAPSQAFGSPQTVTLTSSTAGAVIRYNINGLEPTANDAEVPANGQVQIDYASFLRAKAFVDGTAPGATVRADYELQSAAPTITPSTGTYNVAQSVTLSLSGAPAVIRYTVDGSDPTATSAEYSSPVSVATLTTIKAKAFPTNGWAPSTTTSATLSFNYGTLDLPNASPAGGIFAVAPQMTLTSIAGASIRYTLNGTTPTASSMLYTGAVNIPAGGATLKSIAFHPDWSASAVRTDVYTIDTTAPTITSQYFPAALDGWNRSPVTVSFLCFDNLQVASCSSATSFDQEGGGQTVTGTAVDAAGNQTQLPTTVNIDLTPPTVTMSSPSNGLVTSNSTLSVTANVADTLSGLAAVTCNDVAATVVSGAVSCNVTLRPGRNVVVVSARDVAGNNSSAGVTVTLAGTATQLSLAPSNRTMLIGESATLSLRDEFGVASTNATWQTSDAQILSLSTDDPPILTAVAEGAVTVTASKNGLGAVTQISVVAGVGPETELPVGTTRWRINTPQSTQSRRTAPIYTNGADVDGPLFFTVEPNATITEWAVRAVSEQGEVLWKEAAPGLPLMGDSYGAVIGGVAGEYRCVLYYGEDTFCFKALVRFAGSETALPWRYESAGYVDRPAQGPDGTIFAIEHINGTRNVGTLPDWGNNKQVVILDGATGLVKARVALPPYTSRNACTISYNEPRTLPIIVGGDGNAYLLVKRHDSVSTGSCSGGVLVSEDESWTLWRISPTGAVSSVVVDQCQMAGCNSLIDPQQLLPADVDGVVINTGARIIRFDSEWQRTEYPFASAIRIDLVGEDGLVYLQTSSGGNAITQAFNVLSGTAAWSATPAVALVGANANGGATGQSGTGELVHIGPNGQTEDILPIVLTDPVQIGGGVIGGDGTTPQLVAVVARGPPPNTTRDSTPMAVEPR